VQPFANGLAWRTPAPSGRLGCDDRDMWAASVVLVAVMGSACRLGFSERCTADPSCEDAPDGATGAPYAAAVLADAPLAYFRFDEPGGTVAASVVGGVTGTYEGAFRFGAPGAVGDGNSAVTFDGTTTRIPVGDVFPFAGTAPYSLELWVRPSSITDTRFLIDRRSAAGTEGYTMYLGDTYLLHARTSAGVEFGYVNIGTPVIGAWSHVVATFDGTETVIYLDGVEVGRNVGTAASPIGGGAGAFVIGDNDPGQFNKLAGDLDELAVYGSALSAAQVAAHVQAAGG